MSFVPAGGSTALSYVQAGPTLPLPPSIGPPAAGSATPALAASAACLSMAVTPSSQLQSVSWKPSAPGSQSRTHSTMWHMGSADCCWVGVPSSTAPSVPMTSVVCKLTNMSYFMPATTCFVALTTEWNSIPGADVATQCASQPWAAAAAATTSGTPFRAVSMTELLSPSAGFSQPRHGFEEGCSGCCSGSTFLPFASTPSRACCSGVYTAAVHPPMSFVPAGGSTALSYVQAGPTLPLPPTLLAFSELGFCSLRNCLLRPIVRACGLVCSRGITFHSPKV